MKPEEMRETVYVGLDTELPSFMPYPRFVLKMDISHTAKLLYALLLDRTTLSPVSYTHLDVYKRQVFYPRPCQMRDSRSRRNNNMRPAQQPRGKMCIRDRCCTLRFCRIDFPHRRHSRDSFYSGTWGKAHNSNRRGKIIDFVG